MASSSSAMDRLDYDVFLSFRGTDTRNNFTGHLYDALCRENIKAFIDRRIKRGEEITPALYRVIEGAKVSIIVFSSDYASSTFCLDELVKIMECKESKAQIVLPIFYKVDPSEESYRKAFARHKEMKKVKKWKSALRKALPLAGWHIDDNSNEAEVIRGITTDVLEKLKCLPTCQSKGFELISTALVGQTAINYLEKIWEYLMNDETSRIGIYGMGGVGKTTIVTHINNRFLAVANSFTRIYWVTVPKASDIYKLQNDIAKVIKLEFDGENDEGKRAAMLWQKLEESKKFVLIFDDMWEAFETKDIGIPISANGGKLLLTTRKRQVCQRMKCEQIVKIEPLPKQEAWDLFSKESECQIDDSPELKEVVESVAKEFAGLPLAAVAVARSMRGVVDISEWRNVLYELQKPAEEQNDEMAKVFKALKISYDRLRNDKYRECLLYCCLFPEDYLIKRNNLIEYWIGEGIIEELDSRQEGFDKGNAILNELINVCLLEQAKHFMETNVAFVKMHDVVRDMALTITKLKFMTKVGLRLWDLPKENEWSADIDYVFLMENHQLVRCDSNLAPNCSKLRTLLLRRNSKLTELSSCFFDNMPNLTVLDMRHLRYLKLLPDSITKLRNLRVLLLAGCLSLQYIPSLAWLENLRVLDLSTGTLTKIPSGLEKLINLRVLNLSWNDFSLVLFPTAVLEKLSHLQSLKLEWCYVEVEPNALISLEKLESLSLTFYDFHRFCSYIKSQDGQKLKEYRISVSPQRKFSTSLSFSDENNVYQKAMLLYDDTMDSDGAGKADILLPADIQYLEVRCWDNPIDDILKNQTFSNLQKLVISMSEGMYLFTPDIAKQLLVNVKELKVEWCPYEELITATEEESMIESKHNDYPAIKFQKLMKLRLEKLGRLKSIYRGRIVCPSLEVIEIEDCMLLKRLPFYMQERAEEGRQTNPSTVPPSLKQIKGSDLWWNSLQWDHPGDKSVFQPFFVQHEDIEGSIPGIWDFFLDAFLYNLLGLIFIIFLFVLFKLESSMY